MPILDESITITNRSARDTFAYVTDPERGLVWQSGLIGRTAPDRPLCEGSRLYETWRFLGRTFDTVVEITDYEPGSSYRYRSVEAPFDFEDTWSFAETDGGTVVSYHAEAPVLGGFFARVGDALVTRVYAREVRASLDKLKELLEAGADD